MPADTQNEKRALVTLNQKLDIEKIPQPQGGEELRMLINQTALALEDSLNTEDVHIDARVLSNIELLEQDLNNMNMNITNASARAATDEGRVTGTNKSSEDQRDKYRERATKYTNFYNSYGGAITNRATEYTALRNNARNFNFSSKIPEPIRTVPLGVGVTHDINVRDYLMNLGRNPNEYKLCDEQGKELEEDDDAYILNVGGQEFRLRGLSLPTPGGVGPAQTSIQFDNFRRSPSNVDLPEPLKLSISAIYNGGVAQNGVGNTGMNLINNRKLELHIGNKLNAGQRDSAYNAINTGNVIENQITRTLNTQNGIAEPSHDFYLAYSTALEKLYPDQWKGLETQDLKNQFVDHALTQVPNFQDMRDAASLAQLNIEFRNYVTGRAVFDEETPVDIPASILRDESKLQLWILQNYMTLLPGFLAFYVQHRLNYQPATRLAVGRLVQDYVIQKENNTADDLANTLTSADDYEHDRHKPNNAHNNYMRYLVGASGSFAEQAVEVNNTKINYGMGVTVGPTGMIEVAVVMENSLPTPGANEEGPKQTERLEIPTLKAGDAGAIIRAILRNQNIPEGHVRQHVAFNVMKILMEHMQKKGIDLVGVVDNARGVTAAGSISPANATDSTGVGYGQEFFLESKDGSVRLGHKNSRAGGGVVTNEMTYDEAWFKTTGDVRQKRAALERMSQLFTMSMNQFHTQQESGNAERGLLGKRPWRTRNINGLRGTRRWTKLKNRDTENTYAFSLDQPVSSADGNKQATVSYDGENFHVNLTRQTHRGETVQKSFKTDDVRRLMNLKHKTFFGNTARKITGKSLGLGKDNPRYFDGLELDLMAATNEALFNQIRRNTKISRTNFGIEDPRTGRVYIIGKDGKISSVSYRQEDDEPRRGGRTPFAWLRRGKRSLTKRNREGNRGQVNGDSRGTSNNSTWLARTGRKFGRFMGTRYFKIRDKDMPQGSHELSDEQRKGFFQNADLMGELQQAFKRRIDQINWM